MAEPQVTLTSRGAERILAGHYWVYRSDLHSTDSVEPGDTVRLHDDRGRFLGKGWFSSHSQIALRLLTREDVPIDDEYFRTRIETAVRFRERVVENSTAYRLLYGESDGIPSLIVDRYGDTLVLQTLRSEERRVGKECRL